MREQLGHYRILEQIGSGGMGRVYRARDERLERHVALKVLPEAALADDTARRRFRREALALSRLNHPNIATIHDFDTLDGVDVLVMEHIPGASLDEVLKHGPLPEREVVRLGQQLADALAAAHDRNVIHRDLKPGNVRITPEGRLKVLDFGLARALQADPDARTESITGPFVAGTLPYMAPEQVRGDPVDHRADIYAAGAVLYEMATGARVHGTLSGTPLIAAIVDTPAKPPSALNPAISAELNRIITKALDTDPHLRYQSARELAVDLERLSGPAKPVVLARRRPRRAVAAAIALVAALAAWMAYRAWPRTTVPPDPKSIVIADFENQTDDRQLSDAIRAGLTVQLEQSPYVSVLSRDQVFDALRRMQRADRLPDTETARELALRENVPILLAGRIQRRGGVTRIEARGIDARTEDVLFVEPVEFRREDEVFQSIDALARSVRRNLGESVAGIDQQAQPLARVTTGSFEALKHYSRGADELARGNADGALPLLQTALRVDPNFAMAHRLVARVYETLGNAEKEGEHLTRAYELRASLTDRERLHVEASYLRGHREYEKAVETLTALTNLYPRDAEARYELALAYRDTASMSMAIQELENVVSESPFVTVAYADLVLLLARVRDYERARVVYEEAARRGIAGPRLIWGHGMLLLGEGRTAEARADLTKLADQGDVFSGVARLYLATTDLYEGKMSLAVQELEAAILLDQKARNALPELKRRALLASIALLTGDARDARRHLHAALAGHRADLPPDDLRRLGSLAASAGDLKTARDLLRRLDAARRTVGSAFLQSCYFNLAGEIALGESKPAEAIEAFRNAATQYARPASTTGLARAFAASGDWARARQEWTNALNWKGEILHEGFAAQWVLAHLELARTESRAGDAAAAARHYQMFLALWRDGDDLPARRAAAAEAATLPAIARR